MINQFGTTQVEAYKDSNNDYGTVLNGNKETTISPAVDITTPAITSNSQANTNPVRVLSEPSLDFTPNGFGDSVKLTEWSTENDMDILGQQYVLSYGYKITVSSTLNALTSQMMNPSSETFNISVNTSIIIPSTSVLSGQIVIPQESLNNRSTAFVSIVDGYGNLLFKSGEIDTQSLAIPFEISVDKVKDITFLIDVKHIGENFSLAIVDLMPNPLQTENKLDKESYEKTSEPEYFLIYMGIISEPNDAYKYVSSWDTARDVDTLGTTYGPGGIKVGSNTIMTGLTQSMINPVQENIVLNVAFGIDPNKSVSRISGDIVVARDSLNNRSSVIVSIIDENDQLLYKSPEITSQSLPESYDIDVSGTRKITYVFSYRQIGDPFYIGLVNFKKH